MSVACSATVERFEDFFQDPDGSGARVAAAALSGNREKLASCLRRHPMLSALRCLMRRTASVAWASAVHAQADYSVLRVRVWAHS